MNKPPVSIHPVGKNDFDDWCVLYRAYAEFYRQPMNEHILQTVWQWLMSENLHGAIARSDNHAVGIAHWELILRPLRGVSLCYLHDLYVDKNKRGVGFGGKLLAQVNAAAKNQGCQSMRWLTKADNHIARMLYDKTAVAATEWVMYQQQFDA